jgi:hypothetical protein
MQQEGGEASASTRFVHEDLVLEFPHAPPKTPEKVNVRCTSVRPNGRIVPMVMTIENLPQHCSVRDLQDLMYEQLDVSIRQPLELRYWGKQLDPERLLKDFAVTERSEIQVVVKPKRPEGMASAIPSVDPSRVRLSSHKLQTPIVADGISAEMSVLDLKMRVQTAIAKVSPNGDCQGFLSLVPPHPTLIPLGSLASLSALPGRNSSCNEECAR